MADNWDHIYVVPGHPDTSGEWRGTELRCQQHPQWSADADFTVMDAAFDLAAKHVGATGSLATDQSRSGTPPYPPEVPS